MRTNILPFFFLIGTIFFTSCGPGSGNREEKNKNAEDSIAAAKKEAAIQDSITKAEQSKPVPIFSFTPETIETDPVKDNPNDSLGEGQYPAKTFAADLFFLTSRTDYQISLYGRSYKDGTTNEEDPRSYSSVKKMYKKLTEIPLADLIVYVDENKKTLAIKEKKKPTGKKIGNAFVREPLEELLLETSYSTH